jgi:hypothetical protein
MKSKAVKTTIKKALRSDPVSRYNRRLANIGHYNVTASD